MGYAKGRWHKFALFQANWFDPFDEQTFNRGTAISLSYGHYPSCII
jgi:hypothetical protein